jgi:ABC-2 type transport system ATP-binding protein
MIAAEALTKYYGLKPAILDVSLEIEKGEVLGLLGPNGAGKTTILRILTCFMQPTSGRVTVDGMDCRTDSMEVRKRIGFLPETVPLYSELRVSRFLAFAGSIKGLSGAELTRSIDRAVEDCGLSEHKNRLIKHLSKGLKQRVGLAQALLNDPAILILDEPTTGLDPAQIVEVRHLIRQLGGERTVLLSTHILPEVSQLCQRVIILDRGRIREEGSPENLAHKAQKGLRTIVSVDGPKSEVKQKLQSLKGTIRVIESRGNGDFIVESGHDDKIRPQIARTIVECGWGLKEMKSADLSLEEVFVNLVTEEEGKDMRR